MSNTNPYTPLNSPAGPAGPALDAVPLSAPASDTALSGLSEPSIENGARGFQVLTGGTVSVTTLAGNNRTWEASAGDVVIVGITHVLAATTSDLLLYGR